MTTAATTHTDFFVVTSTVIPVLLLTTTLQTAFWHRYALSAVPRSLREREKMMAVGRALTAAVAAIVVLVSLIGEWTSVQALRHLSDGPGERSWAAAGLGLLLIVNVGGLLFGLVPEIVRGPEATKRTTEGAEE